MPARSTGARIYLSFIGLSLALAGGLFTWLMWRSFERARSIDHWPVVPCTILLSEVEERQHDPTSGIERRFKVLYGYQWEGHAYESELWKLRGSPWSSKEDVAEAMAAVYPVGRQTVCHLDPANPAMAVLEKESKAPGYSLWFPLIFVVGGLGMVAGAWRK